MAFFTTGKTANTRITAFFTTGKRADTRIMAFFTTGKTVNTRIMALWHKISCLSAGGLVIIVTQLEPSDRGGMEPGDGVQNE